MGIGQSHTLSVPRRLGIFHREAIQASQDHQFLQLTRTLRGHLRHLSWEHHLWLLRWAVHPYDEWLQDRYSLAIISKHNQERFDLDSVNSTHLFERNRPCVVGFYLICVRLVHQRQSITNIGPSSYQRTATTRASIPPTAQHRGNKA